MEEPPTPPPPHPRPAFSGVVTTLIEFAQLVLEAAEESKANEYVTSLKGHYGSSASFGFLVLIDN